MPVLSRPGHAGRFRKRIERALLIAATPKDEQESSGFLTIADGPQIVRRLCKRMNVSAEPNTNRLIDRAGDECVLRVRLENKRNGQDCCKEHRCSPAPGTKRVEHTPTRPSLHRNEAVS
jgi:hypothetical protein